MRSNHSLVQWGIAAAGVVALFCVFPPVHVVRLGGTSNGTGGAGGALAAGSGAAMPEALALQLWDGKLLPAAKKAMDAAALLAELRRDPQNARTKYSRTVGLGGAYYYLVQGTGRVVDKKERSVSLRLVSERAGTLEAGNADFVIETGLLFGNAVRDGSGLVDVSSFANSQAYNDLSSELNKLVQTRVFPEVRKLTPGRVVRFAGVVEVADESQDLPPHAMRLVPVMVEAAGPETMPAAGAAAP